MKTADRFGTGPDGETVHRFTLTNNGHMASVMSWGAALTDYRIAGVAQSLVLGADRFEPWLTVMSSFGVIVGRVANRIAGARAPLQGRMLDLERNENGTTILHGGAKGCGSVNWTIDGFDENSRRLSVRLADGQGGFPGNLDLVATYRLGSDGALDLMIEGRTDAPTFCNPAHHAYWNLDGSADLSGHRLTAIATHYLPVNDLKIPLGKPSPVEGTRFDFQASRAVMLPGDGPLDHNLCLDGADGTLRPACRLEAGGVALDISTTAPGLQLYDGAHISTAPHAGHGGVPYGSHAGLAIEPQGWPDAPNHPDYPSVLLLPGQVYRQHTRFHAQTIV